MRDCVVGAFLVVLSVWSALGLASPGLAQELPGPTATQPLGRLALNPAVGQFEEAQLLVLDFAPGAWTPLHSHGGLTLVRVLEGEMTRRVGSVDDTFRAGETWVETPGDVHAAGNDGTTPARVLVTFLLPRGAPLTVVAGAPVVGAPRGPTVSFQSARVGVAIPAGRFDEAATTALHFAPGAWTPLHSHGGLTLVGVVDGDMTVRSGGREVVYRPGSLWIEQPGDVHAAGNTTASEANVFVSFLLRRGDPVTTVAATQAPGQAPRRLPRTGGTGSPAALATAGAAAVSVLGAGLLLRRRLGRR